VRLSDIMSAAGLYGYAEVALVLFLLAFLIIAIATYQPSNRAAMDAASRLPLDDDPAVRREEDARS